MATSAAEEETVGLFPNSFVIIATIMSSKDMTTVEPTSARLVTDAFYYILRGRICDSQKPLRRPILSAAQAPAAEVKRLKTLIPMFIPSWVFVS